MNWYENAFSYAVFVYAHIWHKAVIFKNVRGDGDYYEFILYKVLCHTGRVQALYEGG